MSPEDFRRATPAEFLAIYDAWGADQERRYRGDWERSRWMVTAVMQPHVSKPLSPTDLITFPWEKKPVPKTEPQPETDIRITQARIAAFAAESRAKSDIES